MNWIAAPRACAGAGALALLLGLGTTRPRSPRQTGTVTPELLEQTGTFQSRRVRESSGVAVSRRYPELLWTHNDSGDGPFIYATNAQGVDLGAYRVAGANAEDWEDIALGPCPASHATTCIFIDDLGDNSEHRRGGVIYSVPEPAPPAGAADTARKTGPAHATHIRYADGSHDTEALIVTPQGAAWLITKGRSGPVLRYVLSPAQLRQDSVTLEPADTLGIQPRQALGRLVTGAAMSPDGQRAVVRTYTELFFYRVDGDRLTREGPACWLGPTEPQGEGVDFIDSRTVILTSESVFGDVGTLYRARCPRGGR